MGISAGCYIGQLLQSLSIEIDYIMATVNCRVICCGLGMDAERGYCADATNMQAKLASAVARYPVSYLVYRISRRRLFEILCSDQGTNVARLFSRKFTSSSKKV